MRSIVLLIAFVRGQQLERQFRRIGKNLDTLPGAARARLSLLTLREIGQAARREFPHLYGTPPQQRYLPWGRGTATGFTRACSDNPEVVLRGIALWLAVAYHETKDSPYPFVRARHRRLLRVVRELKELHGAAGREREDVVESWMQPSAAA
ncbi:hypothetical protein [Frateuria sp. STR12]|uniref:hypothetical protein n=1 Tax=Frateuria hangzhouensis TaxID=2995589 RepID=UPI00226088B6|nr:hypothetical protein [Frateuria sp. STR12]MCX7514837.1 hypothetical protein [Frateuria sp. STR12]